ncbi:MAG: metalloregulator ArsR/SmtB family transcription factor [Gemmataceae bacterium]
MKPRSPKSPITVRVTACAHAHTPLVSATAPDPKNLERAAGLFRALGDTQRLRLLHMLLGGEVCVTTLVTSLGEKFSTISQRLRILHTERLVSRRRDGSHVYYQLADEHVKSLVSNALAHADELDGHTPKPDSEDDR